MSVLARAEGSNITSYVPSAHDQGRDARAIRIAGDTSSSHPHNAPTQRSLLLFRATRSGPAERPPTGVDGKSQRADAHHALATEQPATIIADDGNPTALSPAPTPSQRRQLWSAASVGLLRTEYPTHKLVRDIAAELGRSVGAIYGKAQRLNLKRPRHGAAAALPAPVQVIEASRANVDLVSAPAPLPAPSLPASQPALAVFTPEPSLLQSKPARRAERTKMGGRPGCWTENDGALSERLERLFIANYSPGCIAAVLGVTEGSATTRAWVVNCPRRDPRTLRHDVEAARLVDRLAAPLPWTLHSWETGKTLVRKRCSRKGHYIWGANGITLSNDARRQRSYKILTATAPMHAW